MGLFAESRKVISKKGLFSQSRITTPSVITTPPVYWNKEKDEPVQKPVKPAAKPTTVKMPLRPNSVRTEPATSTKKRIGGAQYEPAYAKPTISPPNPVAKLTGSMANRFMSNPQNRAVVQSAPAQFIDKNLRAGTSALSSGISNVGAGIAQFSDQLMSKARSLPMSTLPAFAQTPSTQSAVQAESVAGQQRRANVRSGVENQNATVQKNLNVTDKQTQGMGYGILSSIPQMATLFVPGGQAAFFSSAAGNYASQAEKNGVTPDQALAYGLIGGAAELATEKVFFLLPQSVRKVGQGIVSRVVKAGAGEGFQEAITDPIMGMAEKFIYNPDKAWYGANGVVDPALMGKDALAGAIMGVMFMGLASSNAQVKQKSHTAITKAQTSGTGVPIEVVQEIAQDIKVTQPIQQNAPQPLTGAVQPTLNANVEQPTNNFVPTSKQTTMQNINRNTQGLPTQNTSEGTALTNKGEKVGFRYRIVDASELVTSHDQTGSANPNYPADLQPRSRERVASQTQIAEIANNLQPERLAENAMVSDGAPMIGPDMVVESGNGRTLGIIGAYSQGRGEAYRRMVGDYAKTLGITELPPNPVLVRERTSEVDRAVFVKDANESTVSNMSATENAKSDAGKITPNLLRVFEPGENGEINTYSNRSFVTAFIDAVIPSTERNSVFDANGGLSQSGLARIKNALFFKAYGDLGLMDKVAESTDNDIKRVTNALVAIAPKLVAIKAGISDGTMPDIDVATDIAQAALKFESLKHGKMSVAEYLDQITLERDLTDIGRGVLVVIEKNRNSAKGMVPALNDLLNSILEIDIPMIGQESMFGDVPKVTKYDILTKVWEDEYGLSNKGILGNKGQIKPENGGVAKAQIGSTQNTEGTTNKNPMTEGNLQHFGLTEPGPMTGIGRVVESKLSENIGKGRIGNEAITEAYKKDPVTHKQLTHTQTLEAMNNKMSSYDGTPNSLDTIFDEWADRVDGKRYDAADVALTRVLANEFTAQGRQFKADQAYAMLIEKQTEMGRLIDATKLLYDASTPTAVKTVMDRFLRTVNKEGLAKYGDKWSDMSLKPEEIQRISDLSENGVLSPENIDIIKEEVATRMSLEMPRTAGEVLNSWRRFAMLTSPKTHIRNLVSNAVRAVMEGQKNVTATFLEKALNVPKNERLRAMGWKSDGLQKNQSRVDAVDNAWTQNKKEMSSKMKYEISSLASLEVRKDAFKPGPVKTASNFVMNALQVEDVWFMKPAFDSALGQMMKARGVDVPTVEMIDRAKNAAWDVTFKKMNGLSNAILKWKRTGGIVGGIGEAVLPFVTTPAAIAKTTVEFTPIGFVKTLLNARKDLAITKADKVDALAKSVTGTSYIVAGIIAGMSGMLFGADEKSKKAKEIQELGGGRQKYSIAIPEFMGGGTYTMDWMQPTGTLFFIGAQMGADIAKGKTDYTIDGAIDVVLSGADTFLNQSMLQGVKGIFQNPGSTAEGLAGIGADWINQFIPTIWSQVVRGTDPAQRIGYGGGWLTSARKAIQSKTVPQGIGPLKPLEPKVDVYGNPKPTGFGKTETSQVISRLALSLLSPGFYRPETQDPVAKEVYRVYQSTKDTSALPTTIPTNIGSKQLTDAEKTQFATEYGKGAHSAVQTEISKSGYKSASDEDKVDRLRKAMQTIYDKQRSKMAK